MSLEIKRFLQPDNIFDESHPRIADDDHIAAHRMTARERMPRAVFAATLGAAALVSAEALEGTMPNMAGLVGAAGHILLLVGGANYLGSVLHATLAHAHEQTPIHCQNIAPLTSFEQLR
jgi:hypothetical protein